MPTAESQLTDTLDTFCKCVLGASNDTLGSRVVWYLEHALASRCPQAMYVCEVYLMVDGLIKHLIMSDDSGRASLNTSKSHNGT